MPIRAENKARYPKDWSRTMKIDEAVSILRAHNKWRRAPAHLPEDAMPSMGDPRKIGIAIDTVCDALSATKGDAQPVAWVAADTLNSPHPGCVSSLAYMSQIDRERGREYVPLYAAPVAAQAQEAAPAAQWELSADALDAKRYRWLRTRWGRIADEYDGDSDQLVAIREADSRFEGWDVDPASLDRAIDAAMKEDSHG